MRIDNSGKDRTNTPFFIGTVVENVDPDHNYRVRVRIPKIHDKIDDANLPWAARVDSAFMGVGDEQDLKHSVPEKDTKVLILAMENDINSLLYIGCLYKKTSLTPTNDEYTNNYGIYRKDGQFIGIAKIKKIFKMLFDGDIEIDKVHNITIKCDKDIKIECNNATIKASSKITVDTPNTSFTGNVSIDGDLKAAKTVEFASYASGSLTDTGLGAVGGTITAVKGVVKSVP